MTQDNTSVLDSFEIITVSPTTFKLRTKAGKYFYYGYNANVLNNYTFTIKATVGSPEVAGYFNTTGMLTNVSPSFTTTPSGPLTKTTGTINVFQFAGVNGSNPSGGRSTSDLTWSLGSGSSQFTIDSTGLVQAINAFVEGSHNFDVIMTEASGLSVIYNLTVTYPALNSVTFSSGYFGSENESYSGTVTIVGNEALFKASAYLSSPGGQVNTNITINGSNRSALRKTNVGTTLSSTGILLSAGTYSYSFSCTLSPIECGEASIVWEQEV